MAASYKAIHPLKYYKDFFAKDIRPDGRGLNECRTVTVNTGSISTADGSATVIVGSTSVICGIKLELGQPRAEEPLKGFLLPNVELPPLCSPKFRPGPPSEQAQILTACVNDVASNIMDLEQLCISRDNLVWVLHADIICLDFDGSVEDACITALIAALKTVQLPQVEYDVEIKKIVVDDKIRRPLKVDLFPVSSTYAMFEDEILLVDPTGEEEELSTSLLTIVTDGNDIFAVHKAGGSTFPEMRIQHCIATAKKRATLIHKVVDKALKTHNQSQ